MPRDRIPATVVRDRDRRVDSTIEGDTVRPPQLYVAPMPEGEYSGVIEAIAQALADEPNALIEPALEESDDDDNVVLAFSFIPQEVPPFMEHPGKPAYIAEEEFCAALMEHLPDEWHHEKLCAGRLGFYRE